MTRRSHPDISHLAGWLFADLLLAFAIIVLAASSGGLPADESADAEPTSQTPPSTPATPPPPTAPPGIDPAPRQIVLQSNYEVLTGPPSPGRDAEVARLAGELRGRIAEQGLAGRRAALVLTFGVHPEVGSGQRLATAFNDLVLTTVPETFEGSARRSFDWRSTPIGEIRADVYFFTPST